MEWNTLEESSYMHPVGFVLAGPSGDQVRDYWVMLWQICSVVHLLPLEALHESNLSWEAELS